MAQVTARELGGSGCVCSKAIRKSTSLGESARCKVRLSMRGAGISYAVKISETVSATLSGFFATRACVCSIVASYDSLRGELIYLKMQ